MYTLLVIKRIIEDIILYPFILTGRIISFFNSNKREYEVFFFFPFYHIGGAEKVHAQIAQACGNENCIIFFTRKSHNDLFLKEFRKSKCSIRDISRYTDNKWIYFLNLVWRGILCGYINRQNKKPIIFNGQCNFAYKLSSWIKKDIPQVELIHSLNTFSYIRIPYIPYITRTVMISLKRIEDHKKLYKKYKIPQDYLNRIQFIQNAVPFPKETPVKNTKPFTVLYSGRGGKEKRVHLVTRIAKEVYHREPSVRFEIMGDVSDVIRQEEYPFIKFHGAINDESIIDKIYKHATTLLLTSSTEGFPMVVIEAMSHGCAIIATPVGDIPYHIVNERNGYLFSTIEDENRIVEEGCSYIINLKNNSDLLHNICLNNLVYSKNNFSIEKFNQAYQHLFESLKSAT